jgi:hypothetical protein
MQAMNLLMFTSALFMYIVTGRVSFIILVPVVYISVSCVGRAAFAYRNSSMMMMYAGAYFGRWCADAAVLLYTWWVNLTEIYEMNMFTFVTSLLMVGMRGFYQDLYPCYNMNLEYECSPEFFGASANFYYIFVLLVHSI